MASVLYFQQMQLPHIKREGFTLRPWDANDASSLIKHANNPRVAANLRDGFPHPYTPGDAQKWLDMVGKNKEDVILAIEVQGEAAGGIGLHGMKDVYRYNCEIGYWLSEIHWGKGIATEAVGAMVKFAFEQTQWLRLFASIFENNFASMRVLEKNGFTPEAIHRKAVMKGGKLWDDHMYALLKDQWLGGSPGIGSPSGRSSAD
jgi:RimJ/RimL family protein N-acetyltransferase